MLSFRSNGGTLIIDAAKDSVQHYGELAYLNIKAVATSSYHEFGYTAQGQINTGRVVIEDAKVEKQNGDVVDAAIDGLFLVGKVEEGQTIASSFETIIVETKGDAKMPTLDRSQVTINTETGTKVCEVKTPSEDNDIWLTKNGIYENVTVTTPGATTAGTTAPTTNTDTAQAGWEIANAAKRNDHGQLVDSTGTVTADTTKAVVEEKASQEDLNKGTTLFAGGAGTETNPYLISNEIQLDNTRQICTDSSTENISFRIISDFTIKDKISAIANRAPIRVFYGTFDGDGHTITYDDESGSKHYVQLIRQAMGGSVFKNLTISCKNTVMQLICYANGNVLIDNVDYKMAEENSSIKLNYSEGCYVMNTSINGVAGKLQFKDCDVSGKYVLNSSYSALFVSGYAYVSGETFAFDSCSFRGTFTGPKTYMFIGNTNGANDVKPTVIMTNCSNYGTITGTKNSGFFANNNSCNYYANYESEALAQGINKEGGSIGLSSIDTSKLSISISENGEISLTSTLGEGYSYRAVLSMGIAELDAAGRSGSAYFIIREAINADGEGSGIYLTKAISDNLTAELANLGLSVPTFSDSDKRDICPEVRYQLLQSSTTGNYYYVFDHTNATASGYEGSEFSGNGALSLTIEILDSNGYVVGSLAY